MFSSRAFTNPRRDHLASSFMDISWDRLRRLRCSYDD